MVIYKNELSMKNKKKEQSALQLNSRCARSVGIFSQIKQELTEALLSRTAGTTFDALAGHIDQFRDSLPAGTTGRSVFSVGKEFFGLGAGLGAGLVRAIAVRHIKVVNILLGFLNRGGLLLRGRLGSSGEISVSARSPVPRGRDALAEV